MKITKRREHLTNVTFQRFFERIEQPGSGFSFKCSEDGTVDMSTESAKTSYEECLKDTTLVDRGPQRYESRYTSPALGNCDDCGREVSLDGFTNTCECGADYNMSGSRLAPREQWGEETGESVSDILAVDSERDYGRDY